MTKKDYIKFADEFKKIRQREYLSTEQIKMFASCITSFMKIFKADNPNFDEERFYKAVMED